MNVRQQLGRNRCGGKGNICATKAEHGALTARANDGGTGAGSKMFIFLDQADVDAPLMCHAQRHAGRRITANPTQ
jgi:hypothetical protein